MLDTGFQEKPADKEHPFGHQRAEYIATLIMAILLAVAGVEFIKASYSRLTEPQMSTVTVGVFVFIVLTILAKAWLGGFSAYLGKRIDSQALKADALHHYTDSISSILVLAAVVGAKFGYVWFDSLGGIAVGIMLIWAGFSIAKDSADSLMGKPPTPEVIDKIKKLCLSVKGVINTHDIVVHSYGDQRFISVHVEVDQDMSSLDSHEIGDRVENELKNRLKAYTTVHVDPIDTKSKEVKKANEVVAGLVKTSKDIREFHDLRLAKNGNSYVIIFDLVPEDRSIKHCDKLASCRKLKKELQTAFPDCEMKIEIDPFYTYN